MIELKTESDFRDAHRKMWQWLADNPEKNKSDYPELKNYHANDYDNSSRCFACGYSEDINCHECPINWGKDILCLDLESPFLEYEESQYGEDFERRTKYALIVKKLWPEPKKEK